MATPGPCWGHSWTVPSYRAVQPQGDHHQEENDGKEGDVLRAEELLWHGVSSFPPWGPAAAVPPVLTHTRSRDGWRGAPSLPCPLLPGTFSAGSMALITFNENSQAEVDDGEDEEEAEEQLPADAPDVIQTPGFLNLQDLPPACRDPHGWEQAQPQAGNL
ncbi:hypothetical protein DV515_00009396 [Chloebia gouldiae]|uniref:Uncharacterized protein n=1 Tax=Chloebia gouldiae TaxID=44316 RepID=A0A3L8SBQ6_CHLGU|nr:hypothetical protein DV515_00009396 [Chloebia gouldiae]